MKGDRMKDKVMDYKRFGFTLLCVSVFLYLGVLIKINEVSSEQVTIMLWITVLFTGASGYFFLLSAKCKKKVEEDSSSNY
ncbi:hypothetical protein Q73_09835 [Bacillus coahuilensis m2-6]|uniref:Group-specific protein n=2 Tax=Bacillus coahuilensis TaxID=408580 RepID=A0A147K785_9BACI|nr:hypothetical protein Q75_10425 [Bacillus coahuilensis p1.1.43]KUP07307.1 hypothetical protein Q73_09835 [Bacillus coahuilensis m2-6]